MKERFSIIKNISGVTYYRVKTMFTIALVWTFVDAVSVYIFNRLEIENPQKSFLLRGAVVFIMSFLISNFFPTTLRKFARKYPLWLNLILKFISIIVAAMLMNFVVYLLENGLIDGLPLPLVVNSFFEKARHFNWILQHSFYWILLLLLTQLYIEINEKYAPGVFKDILVGKYYTPKQERRIVMFIDLKDSTPIAERLGHQRYFLFIRDFINLVSIAAIENYGRIYQYVGDEIVVSWPASKLNAGRALKSIIYARKLIQQDNDKFRTKYGEVPAFRSGIHVGEVTVGEVGVVKKDLVISGDTMNTTARIRSACTEFNVHFIVSDDFIHLASLQNHQYDELGDVDLKGKSASTVLHALHL